MKKRIVSALLAGFLLVSATACGKQPAADAASDYGCWEDRQHERVRLRGKVQRL